MWNLFEETISQTKVGGHSYLTKFKSRYLCRTTSFKKI